MHGKITVLAALAVAWGAFAADAAWEAKRQAIDNTHSVTPESLGISSRAVSRWVEKMDKIGGIHSFVLLRHGKTVAEGWWNPYRPMDRHMLYSLSKSFTSTAIGMVADEGKLDLDERVADIFADCLPASPDPNLRSMRVRDLLCMTTGHAEDSSKSFGAEAKASWTRDFLSCPVPVEPGRKFLYDSGASYMLSAIVHRRTGQRPSEYLQSRLFAPLGIACAQWNRSPEGEDLGGWGLNLTTRDIAKFGQFWLQKGEWNGKRLLSRDYVEQASSVQTRNREEAHHSEGEDWRLGYGFQFWMCQHGCYRAAGAYGQLAIVMPDKDAVLAVTSKASMQKTMECLWEFLPEMQDKPLPEDSRGVRELAALTGSLTLPVVKGEVSGASLPAVCSDASGGSVAFAQCSDGWMLSVTNAAWSASIPVGYGKWKRSEVMCSQKTEMDFRLPGRQQVAASGAWTSPDTFTARLWFVETPHDALITFLFKDGRMTPKVVSTARNIAF